ncbi:MAG: hypothetical protein FWF78_08415 [Defluviitaleaceae bacterium]|nr:hypothetical protein [Defluviitaleaceae bacterium]
MKKILVAFLLIGVMALSFAAPAMANTAATQETVKIEASYQEITPFFEQTVIYHRRSLCGCDRLQFRVWGMISGRWLTDWAYV